MCDATAYTQQLIINIALRGMRLKKIMKKWLLSKA